MNYQDLIKSGSLRKEKIGFEQINKILERAHKNIKSARVLLDNNDEEGAFRFAYEAMLMAGRALVFSYGLRPGTTGSHKTVVEFSKRILGNSYEILVAKFDKMRKKRHYLIYGIGFTVSSTETENAIRSAFNFIDRIEEFIQKKNPQKKLFNRRK